MCDYSRSTNLGYFLLPALILLLCQGAVSQEIKRGLWREQEVEYLDGEVCVKVRDGSTREDLITVASGVSATVAQGPDKLRGALLKLPNGADVFDVINTLKNNHLIEACEPNLVGYPHVDPDDPYFSSEQWPLWNRGNIPTSVGHLEQILTSGKLGGLRLAPLAF